MSSFDYYRRQVRKQIKRSGGVRAAIDDWKKEWLEPHPQGGEGDQPPGSQEPPEDARQPTDAPQSDGDRPVEQAEPASVAKRPDIIQTESGFSFKAPTVKKVCFGFEVDKVGRQKPIYMDVQNHTFVVGITGGGKSVTMNAIVAQLAEIGPDLPGDLNADKTPYKGAYCAIVGVDLKGGIELSFWAPRLSFLATELNEVDFLLDKLHEENARRQKHLRAIGAKKIIPSKDWPLIIVLMDELAEATASGIAAPGKKEEIVDYEIPLGDKSRQDKLRRLSATSRSQGIFFLCATQRPSADLVPPGFRSNFGQVLCHRVKTAIDVDVCMGKGSSSSYPAHQLPSNVPGMMYAQVVSRNDVPMCRAFYIEEEKTKEIAERNRHKKVKLSWLFMPKSLYAGSVMQEYNKREHEREEEEKRKQAEGQIEEQAPAGHSPEDDFSVEWPADFVDPEEPLDESRFPEPEEDDLETDFEPIDDEEAVRKMNEALKLFTAIPAKESVDVFDEVDGVQPPEVPVAIQAFDLPEIDLGDLFAAGAVLVEDEDADIIDVDPISEPEPSAPSSVALPPRTAFVADEDFFSDTRIEDLPIATVHRDPVALPPRSVEGSAPVALPPRTLGSFFDDDDAPVPELEETLVGDVDSAPYEPPVYSVPESTPEDEPEYVVDESSGDHGFESADNDIWGADDDIIVHDELISGLFDLDFASVDIGDPDPAHETITAVDEGFAEMPTLDGSDVDEEDEDAEWEVVEPLEEAPF